VQLFIYLALRFMTPDDLHDRRMAQKNSEPYGLSIFLSRSIGVRRANARKPGPRRKTGTSDIEG
jgi:hypothetical protein